jgi:DNA polymerase/3'-5' exonuclease PolX
MELEKAKAIAEQVKALLESACERITIAGSIRRQKPDVGDIELLCIPKYSAGIIDQLDGEIGLLIGQEILGLRRNKLGSTTYGPKNKLLVHLESGIGVDVFSTTQEQWPVALFVRTGGKETNKDIASRALEWGLRFHAYGRGFTRADGSELICRCEADVFRAVGLAYREPWERR